MTKVYVVLTADDGVVRGAYSNCPGAERHSGMLVNGFVQEVELNPEFEAVEFSASLRGGGKYNYTIPGEIAEHTASRIAFKGYKNRQRAYDSWFTPTSERL